MRAVASEVGRRTSCTCSEFGEEDIGHATPKSAVQARNNSRKDTVHACYRGRQPRAI